MFNESNEVDILSNNIIIPAIIIPANQINEHYDKHTINQEKILTKLQEHIYKKEKRS